MNPKSIQILIELAYAAQKSGIIPLKDTRIVLESVEDAETFLKSLQKTESSIEEEKE